MKPPLAVLWKTKMAKKADNNTQAENKTSEVKVIPTAAETVAHLEQALLWFKTTDTDSLKLLQLRNFILIAKKAIYNEFLK